MNLWHWFKGTKNPWTFRRVLQRTDAGPYMVRYSLLVTRWLTIYVNHILTPDFDTRLHTHPWKVAYSVKLQGFYWEELADQFPLRRPGRVSRIPRAHRIVYLSDTPVWTLFVGLGAPRSWGFLNDDGTVTPGPSANGRML